MVDGCNCTANILLLLTENMSIMTAHYYNPENPGIWTRAIPEFGIRKTADCNANLQLYLCTDTSTRLNESFECILTIYNIESQM